MDGTALDDVRERAVTAARRWLAGSSALERASAAVAMVVLGGSLVLTWLSSQQGDVGSWFVLAAPFVAVATFLLPVHRHVLLALAAAVTAAAVPDSDPLATTVVALIFLAVVGSTLRLVWFTAVVTLVGSWAGYAPHPAYTTRAAFVATAIGLAIGLLVRSTGQAGRLRQETQAMRARSQASEQQARWLEQRTGLARELHDVVGHHVTAMVVQAEAGHVGDSRAALRQIGDLGRSALGELDALVVHLRDPTSQLPMSAPPRLGDIDELLAAPLRHQGVEVVVDVDPEPGLDETGVLTVYRIAQEALTNVARHAQARHAWVEVRRVAEHVRLRITDDGIGPPRQPDRGSGLLGIHERVAARGGVWELGHRLGGGTILDVLIPASPSGAA